MCTLMWAERIMRRLAMMGLIMEASQKVDTTVGVLSLPGVGVCHARGALMEMKTSPLKTSTTNSRS